METYQDLELKTGKEYLHGWIFTYNAYTGLYMATNKDNYTKLFSEISSEAVIKSSSQSSLEDMIIRNQGDLRKIIDYIKINLES